METTQLASVDRSLYVHTLPETLATHEGALRTARALDRLAETPYGADLLAPKETLTCGGAVVENQEVTFIAQPDGPTVSFKLTESAWQQTVASVDPAQTEQGYMTLGNSNQEIATAEAYVLRAGGMEIKMSKPATGWNCMDGMVTIRRDASQAEGQLVADNEQFGEAVDGAMRTVFGIANGMDSPDVASEDAYKSARLNWHHKRPAGQETPAIGSLQKVEVFAGYSTVVEIGKHTEYEAKHGEIALIHTVSSLHNLPNIVRGGLVSTMERYKRGVMHEGQASYHDLQTGGADSVFTRMVTEKSLENGDIDTGEINDITIALKPKLMDRTDWYAYSSDHNGSTNAEIFAERVSPDELLNQLDVQGMANMGSNEQMFRTGIGSDAIAGIAVASQHKQQQVIDKLRGDGIAQVNGISVEDFVQIAPKMSQVIDMAHGRSPRALQDGAGFELPGMGMNF